MAPKNIIKSIFKILIENAIKYNTNENVLIDINHIVENDTHLIQITDNGIGIDPKFHNQIFDLIKLVSESFENLSDFGITFHDENMNLEILKRDLEEELLALSDAHYSKYFKDPLEQKKA